MKFLITFLALQLAYFQCLPQSNNTILQQAITLHTYVFANTNDSTIGLACEKDFENITREFEFISIAANLKYDQSNRHYFKGNNFALRNMDSLIKMSLPQSKFSRYDVVILYITTHGFRRSDDTTDFPNLVLESDKPFVNAKNLHDHFRNKIKAGLHITIIDACNNISSIDRSFITVVKKYPEVKVIDNNVGEYKKFTIVKKENIPIIVTNDEFKTYKRLFKEVSGEIIITSSQPGYVSWVDDLGSGSYFTSSLIEALHGSKTLQKPTTTWEEILVQAKKNTIFKIKDYFKRKRWDTTKANFFIPVWNHGISLIKKTYPYYDMDMQVGKSPPEQERYFLNCRYDPNRLDSQKIMLTIGANPEYFRSIEMMLDEIDEVEYKIYHKENDSKFFLESVLSRNKNTKFEVGCISNKFVKVMAILKFKDGKTGEVRIMH
jgi:hypothetical protein